MVEGAPDSRLALALEAHRRYLRHLTRSGGGSHEERDGILLLAGPHERPLIVNTAWRLDERVPAEEVIAHADRFFGRRRRRYELMCVAGADEDLRSAALARGFASAEGDPVQLLDGEPTAPAAVLDGIDIRVVRDVVGHADLVAVGADAIAIYGVPEEFFRAILARPATVLDPAIHAVVAYDGDRPVASAQVMVEGEVGYVGWVGVVRDAMRRGLGRLVTDAVVRAGLERGARRSVLVASPMGAPLYRRMGFVDVGALEAMRSPRRP
ncbi:MAG TPA: GNAT family N-acetyltransferase [Candidatus Limnocylindrales bacterium]|nr:GNAT family N-acetyltransferase [Candidatus Limnocylindrales bacterium]